MAIESGEKSAYQAVPHRAERGTWCGGVIRCHWLRATRDSGELSKKVSFVHEEGQFAATRSLGDAGGGDVVRFRIANSEAAGRTLTC